MKQLKMYNYLVLCHMSYDLLAWGSKLTSLVKLQKNVVHIITGSKYNAHTDPIFKTLKFAWESIIAELVTFG